MVSRVFILPCTIRFPSSPLGFSYALLIVVAIEVGGSLVGMGFLCLVEMFSCKSQHIWSKSYDTDSLALSKLTSTCAECLLN